MYLLLRNGLIVDGSGGAPYRGDVLIHGADITAFDPETIRSRATYSDPERAPEGIELVLRNGREVFRRNEAYAH